MAFRPRRHCHRSAPRGCSCVYRRILETWSRHDSTSAKARLSYGCQDFSKMSIPNRWLEPLPTHQTHNSFPGSSIMLCKSVVRMPRIRYRLILWPLWNFLTAPQPTIASLSLHEGEMSDTDRCTRAPCVRLHWYIHHI